MSGECRFTTRNTEYHLVGAVCVAVRDLESGRLVTGHAALGQSLCGCVRLEEGGLRPVREPPDVGLCLVFRGPGRDVLTTPVLAVAR